MWTALKPDKGAARGCRPTRMATARGWWSPTPKAAQAVPSRRRPLRPTLGPRAPADNTEQSASVENNAANGAAAQSCHLPAERQNCTPPVHAQRNDAAPTSMTRVIGRKPPARRPSEGIAPRSTEDFRRTVLSPAMPPTLDQPQRSVSLFPGVPAPAPDRSRRAAPRQADSSQSRVTPPGDAPCPVYVAEHLHFVPYRRHWRRTLFDTSP